jgi:hypothetical protein
MTNNTVEQFVNEMAGVRTQSIYLDLINDRSDKVNDTRHKIKVLTGYNIIMDLVNRSNKLVK